MEDRRLQAFLLWGLALNGLTNLIYVALAIVYQDGDLWFVSFVNAGLIAALWISRELARGGRAGIAATIVALAILVAIIAVLPVFAFAWPSLAMASIVSATIVLPYLDGRPLASIVMTSFIVGVGVSFYGLFIAEVSAPPTILQKTLLLITRISTMVLILGMMVQFVQRLRQTIAETTAAYQSEHLARARAERLAEQARRLHEVTARLSRALPIQEIARIVLEQGVRICGADSGGFWLIEDGRLRLQLAHNYSSGMITEYADLPLEPGLPGVEAVLRRRALFVGNRQDYALHFPAVEERSRRFDLPEQIAFCCLPLEAEDRVLGLLSFTFFRDRIFEDAEQVVLLTLAHHTAQALETCHLLQRATAADQRKDEFLALLGHELRNPLAPIATAIEVMKLRGAGDKELPILERQVRHLIGLVDDLLDVSRVTRGKIRLDRKRIDLSDAVDDAVEMTSPLMERKAHSLTIRKSPVPLWVDADLRRIAQVIANLLTNAARYTPASGAIIVSMFSEAGRVGVTVQDNGNGIDPAQLAGLFEPFAQGQQPIDRSGGGLGLGLMLVKSLTELHNGEVRAHSEGQGKGSRFTILLPAAASTFEEEQTPVWLPPLDGMLRQRVLIVDDNKDAAKTLSELLECYGCQTAIAFDGPSALEVASTFQPAVAILDIGLPVMDGYELCRRLRASLGHDVRMLSLSGYGQEEDRGKSAEAGFAAHLVKPIDAVALMAALQVLV